MGKLSSFAEALGVRTPRSRIEGVKADGEVYIVSPGLDEEGREVPDPIPMAIPAGMKPAVPTLREMVQRMVRDQLVAQAADAAGFDTFEESDDFDIPDDPVDMATPYEMEFEGLPIMQMRNKDGGLMNPQEVRDAFARAVEARIAANRDGTGDVGEKPESEPVADKAAAIAGSLPEADIGSGAAKK